MAQLLPWAIDALVLLGLSLSTIAVFGMYRLDDLFLRLHAASKTALVGTTPLLVANALLGGMFAARALLIFAFLVIATPAAAHAIARAAFRTGVPPAEDPATD